jgi:hypothetical protein
VVEPRWHWLNDDRVGFLSLVDFASVWRLEPGGWCAYSCNPTCSLDVLERSLLTAGNACARALYHKSKTLSEESLARFPKAILLGSCRLKVQWPSVIETPSKQIVIGTCKRMLPGELVRSRQAELGEKRLFQQSMPHYLLKRLRVIRVRGKVCCTEQQSSVHACITPSYTYKAQDV